MTTQTQSRLPAQPGTQLTVEEKAKRLDEIAERCAREVAAPIEGRIGKVLVTSRALTQIRAALTNDLMEQCIMPLQNSALGFLTDKQKEGGYDIATVREVTIEALLRDFRMTGNEVNIIAGRFYGTQNGYFRKLKEIPGLTDLRVVPGTPTAHNGQTVVRMALSCKLDGKPWTLKDEKGQDGRVFVIRVNSGMGADAIIGKALRKAYKAAYDELTGSDITDDEPGLIEAGNTPAESAKTKLTASGNGTHEPNSIGNEQAGEDLHSQIDAECLRVGATPEKVADLVRQSGAKKLRQCTIRQAEAILAELGKLPSRE